MNLSVESQRKDALARSLMSEVSAERRENAAAAVAARKQRKANAIETAARIRATHESAVTAAVASNDASALVVAIKAAKAEVHSFEPELSAVRAEYKLNPAALKNLPAPKALVRYSTAMVEGALGVNLEQADLVMAKLGVMYDAAATLVESPTVDAAESVLFICDTYRRVCSTRGDRFIGLTLPGYGLVDGRGVDLKPALAALLREVIKHGATDAIRYDLNLLLGSRA